MQLRVVHMAEVTYTPTGILNTDLSRLKNPSDGSMDNVHTLRDQYGADLVSLLTTTTSDAGGLASTMQHPSHNFESSGFNVNVWDQLGLLPILWPMRSDTIWAVCTTGRIRLGTAATNCRRFVLENVGTKEAKGTGRSCPTIPTLLLMATGFPFLESERPATSEPRSATRAPRTMLRCFPSPHPACPTSGPPRFKPFFQPFSIVWYRKATPLRSRLG